MKGSFIKFFRTVHKKIREYFGVTFDERRLLIFLGVFVLVFSLVLFFMLYKPQDENYLYMTPNDFDYGHIEGDIFADVAKDHPNAYALAYLKSYGVIQGYSDITFRPDDPMNRAAFMKMLAGAFRKHPHKLHYSNCFNDVQDEWFAPYVCYGKSQGWIGEEVVTEEGAVDEVVVVVDSEDANFFRPAENITRADALKIFMKAFGIQPIVMEDSDPRLLALGQKYTDIILNEWYIPYLLAAEQNDWFEGMTKGNRFDPNEEMTRAHICELLFRVIVTTLPVY